MNVTARDPEEVRRLALASALAFGLHIGLLLGVPTTDWLPRQSRPLRFDVVLLPPLERPENPAPPTATAPESPESPAQPGPAGAGAAPEPVIPPPEPQPIPSPAPPPPPQPVATAPPAAKLVAPKVAPAKPAVATTSLSLPRTPAKPTTLAKVSALPDKPTPPSHKATVAEPASKPAPDKAPPAPKLTPMETFRPSPAKPLADRVERPGRGGTRTGATGHLDSAALLSQIAGLDAETQRRAGGAVRERRVNLADTRSLAGFYAADWARKVTRVGEMNFPDAARRSNPGAGPLLDVAIQADGGLRHVRVLRSSGNAELDQAARRIVQLAAPYPPFPPELRQQVELLHIEAPWRFDPRGQVQVR